MALKSVWFSQLPLSQDAITVAALAGRENPGLEVGTSVVPIYPRHPLVVANAAQTAHAATGGRFTLGVGLGSKGFLGPVYGVDYPPPIKHLREYLAVLKQVFAGEAVDFDGDTVRAHAPGLSTVGGDVPIIVAAMGPQALRVTGELSDGTLPFLAGPRALAEQIVPHLPAGKRILAAVLAIVTNEPGAVRALAVEQMGFYAQIPSYQRILAAEGVDHPADLGGDQLNRFVSVVDTDSSSRSSSRSIFPRISSSSRPARFSSIIALRWVISSSRRAFANCACGLPERSSPDSVIAALANR